MSSALLLDTHVFLWWCAGNEALPESVRQTILKAERVVVSSASVWEAHIKVALGKLTLPADFEEGIAVSGFEPLTINFAHSKRAAQLPTLHRAPFDRMLIAQAIEEDLMLVTHDGLIAQYQGVKLLVF